MSKPMERVTLTEFGDALYLLLGDVLPMAMSRRSMFVGERAIKITDATHGRKIHVISTAQGGEVRGYFLIDGALHLTLPAYPQEWPEVDAAVKSALAATAVHS